MSYRTKPEPLGISWSDILSSAGDVWKKAAPALKAGSKILNDPYLPETACEVIRLSNVVGGRPPGPPCPKTPPTAPSTGVGLRHAIVPIKIYSFHVKYPWAIPVGVAGLLGMVFYAGYRTGKR